MKTQKLRRREFLKSASAAVGVASLIPGLQVCSAQAAEASPAQGAKAKEELEKVFTELQAQGRAYLSVPKKDGQFLNLLVKAVRAQNILEIGTSIGTSTVWMSLALEETGGKLTTIEILPERVAMAKKHVGNAGLAHRVTFKEGDAHEIVQTLEGPFDLVFLDADKDGQPDYFKKLYPKKISPGGLLLSHNAIRQRDSIQEYLDLVTKHPDFDTVIISATMDDGFAVSYRHRKS